MKLLFRQSIASFPLQLTPAAALDFYRSWPDAAPSLLIMAANWRGDPEFGEEEWFEELTADELEDEGFLEEFKDATIQLWMQ